MDTDDEEGIGAEPSTCTFTPNQQQIRMGTAEIRARWSSAEHRRRAPHLAARAVEVLTVPVDETIIAALGE